MRQLGSVGVEFRPQPIAWTSICTRVALFIRLALGQYMVVVYFNEPLWWTVCPDGCAGSHVIGRRLGLVSGLRVGLGFGL